jgi:hypothetical protein
LGGSTVGEYVTRIVGALRCVRGGQWHLFTEVLLGRRPAPPRSPAAPRRIRPAAAIPVVAPPAHEESERLPPDDDLYVQMSLRLARIALDSIPSSHDRDTPEEADTPARTEQRAS